MKHKLLKSIKQKYDIRYLKNKILLIDYKQSEIEEFESIKEALSFLIASFCGIEIHQQYLKRGRFRRNLIKYGNNYSKGAQRNSTNS